MDAKELHFYKRDCEHCKAAFTTPWPNKRYCSMICKKAAVYKRAKTDKRKCLECGKIFMVKKHSGSECCSGRCGMSRRFKMRENIYDPRRHQQSYK